MSDKILRALILITVFLFPFYLIRFSIFGIPTTLIEVVIYMLFLVWLMFFLRHKSNIYLAYRTINENKTVFIGLVLFIFGALLASILSENQKISFGIFKAYFFDPILFFIVFISTFNQKKIKEALEVLVLSALSILFISELSLILGKLSVFFSPITYDLRFKGIFNSPNFLAMSMAPLILISFYFIFNTQNKTLKSLWWAVLILAAPPFIFTFSYSAFLGVFIALIFSAFFYAKKKMKIILPIFIFIIGTILFISQVSSEKMQNILITDGRSSFVSREMVWSSAADILKDNYIFGIGPGMFQKYYLDYQSKFDTQYLEWAIPYPHNVFLAFWVQNGLIGFLGFLIILFWIWKRIWKRSDLSLERSDLFALVLSFFIYFLIHGMFDTPYWKNDLALTFFFFLGVGVLTWRQGLQNKLQEN